ncbi:MAG TPA: amidohydrolase family protein [Caulobacteraceae bacterium]|jgi:2-pyrone-4,6-dicarboxylate lactonase|nr:amidohydrolase family protein [Caulobacteraceae bacterium]
MADAFPMSAGYKPFHPNPSKPTFRLPAGAVDAHCHVFGPGERFPYHPTRKYTPCDAPAAKLFALRDYLGFSRNVIVQASCHGPDNRALVDALEQAGELARGVAVVDEDVTDAELQALDAAGVRGIRFNFVPRLADESPHEVYKALAARVAHLGWHIVVYFEAHDLARLRGLLTGFPTPIVVDHLAVPDVSRPVADNTDFTAFMELMAEKTDIWVKVTCPERISKQGPPYDDFVPYGRALVDRFPDRVIWGTDWPHPNMFTHVPDDGQLVDMIPKIATTPAKQRAMLVDNPMRLYWAEGGK